MAKIIESSVLFAGSLATILVLLFPPRLVWVHDRYLQPTNATSLDKLPSAPDYTSMVLIIGAIIGTTLLAYFGIKAITKG